MTARVVGLVIVLVSRRTGRPASRAALSAAAMAPSTCGQVAACPCCRGPVRRWLSYRGRMDAWPTAHSPPRDSGWSALPSSLIGRPSRVLTSRPQPAVQAPQVEA